MSRLIIFCEHAVETLEYFSRQLAEAFENWGCEVFWMDFDHIGLSVWKLRQALQGREAVLVTFNFIGLSGEDGLWEVDGQGLPGASIWESLQVRCLNIIVDHPIYYYKILRYRLPDMRAFCIDRDHVIYMKRFYPDVPCEFMPIAGNLAFCAGRFQAVKQRETFGQWLERPLPVVFTANYVPLTNIEKQFNRLEPEYRDFYYEIIDAFIRQPEKDLLTVIEFYMRREIPDLSERDLRDAMSTMQGVDLWIRTYFREKTVLALADGGIPVHVFGKDWEQVSCRHKENLIISKGAVNSIDCVQAAANSKIALNTMPWFRDGAHDRIFTAMLQGALALTDGSAYLREHFQDQETLVYYDLHRLEALPGQVAELFKQPERMYVISCHGQEAAENAHTWKQRAAWLKQFM